MAQFSDFGPASRYGSWGIWDSVNGADSPRAAAIIAFRDTVQALWADGRNPSVFDNGLVLRGEQGTDSLTGSGQNDALFGLAGNDVMLGQAGNDILYGGLGDDTMAGGHGADWLNGGLGNDQMDGGTGNDTYLVNTAVDEVTELAGQGSRDQVAASVSYGPAPGGRG